MIRSAKYIIDWEAQIRDGIDDHAMEKLDNAYEKDIILLKRMPVEIITIKSIGGLKKRCIFASF